MASGFLACVASSICGALLLGVSSTHVLAADDLVQFDPATCEFGAKLEPYYDKAIAKRQALPAQAQEEEVSYPVDLPFHGIKVTAVFIGYEWHGIYFDAPPEQVRSLFRQLGYRVPKTVTCRPVVMRSRSPHRSSKPATRPANKAVGAHLRRLKQAP